MYWIQKFGSKSPFIAIRCPVHRYIYPFLSQFPQGIPWIVHCLYFMPYGKTLFLQVMPWVLVTVRWGRVFQAVGILVLLDGSRVFVCVRG